MNYSKAKGRRAVKKFFSSTKSLNKISEFESEIRENYDLKKLIKNVKEKEIGKYCFMGEGIAKW